MSFVVYLNDRPCIIATSSRRKKMTLCVMNYYFTISELIMVQWAEMKAAGFVPQMAKSVEHETRNGIQLCASHHSLFDAHCYYIRWMPEVVF